MEGVPDMLESWNHPERATWLINAAGTKGTRILTCSGYGTPQVNRVT